MVNQVQNYNSAYMTDAMQYAQHAAVVEHQDSILSDMKSSLMMAPLVALPMTFSAAGDYNAGKAIMSGGTYKKTKFLDKFRNIPEHLGESFTHIGDLSKNDEIFTTMQTAWKNSDGLRALRDVSEQLEKLTNIINDSKSSKEAKKAAQKALDDLKGQYKSLEKAMKRGSGLDDVVKSADDAVDAAKTVGKKGFFSKIGDCVSKPFKALGKAITGSSPYKAFKATEKGGKIIEKLGKFGKVAKRGGAIFDLVIEGGVQLFTEVIPAFKMGGFKSGMKQIGKSGLQVAGSVGGWAAGASIGSKIGMAVGSIFPGAGTVIGGAIGSVVGGLLGSSLLSGAAKKITGKSETEKLAQQQTMGAPDGSYNANTPVAGGQQSFGSLTNNAPMNTQSLVAKNPDGSYNFAVPNTVFGQTAANTNVFDTQALKTQLNSGLNDYLSYAN